MKEDVENDVLVNVDNNKYLSGENEAAPWFYWTQKNYININMILFQLNYVVYKLDGLFNNNF